MRGDRKHHATHKRAPAPPGGAGAGGVATWAPIPPAAIHDFPGKAPRHREDPSPKFPKPFFWLGPNPWTESPMRHHQLGKDPAMTESRFEEPECIWRADRSWKGKHEELRLERGSYEGHATYTLRVFWRTDDGQMRWSQAKPTSSGKCWASLNLKSRELASLGALLLAESQSPQPALDVSEPASTTRGDGQPASPQRQGRRFQALPAGAACASTAGFNPFERGAL